MRQFHSRQTDPARRAQHQDPVLGSHSATVEQGMVGRAINQSDCGSHFQVGIVRHWNCLIGLDNCFLGKAAAGVRAHHPIANLKLGHARADGRDRSGHLSARCKGQRRLELVLVLNDQEIGEVHAGCCNGDADFIGSGFGCRNVFDNQALGWTMFLTEQCAHISSPVHRVTADLTGTGVGVNGQGSVVCIGQPPDYLEWMNAPWQTGYRLKVDPIQGRIRAMSNGLVLADTYRARVMFETRLPYSIYVPAEDVVGLDRVCARRTFCPFKGTAIYRDLLIGDRRIEEATWSYHRALPEASGVEGMVGFMPGVVETWDADAGLPQEADDGILTGALVDWLMREAWREPDAAALTRGLAHGMLQAGIIVSRLNVTLANLHPLLAGMAFVWHRDTDMVRIEEARHELLSDPSYQNSPTRHVMDGLGGVRQPLTVDDVEFSFPIMDELRASGATDYVAMPLPFANGRTNALTMTCDHPNGFTTANLGLVFECSAMIGRLFEVHTLKSDAESLLTTFLGKRTGRRVLGGAIKRGDGEEIEAAVLFCDLRGSSRLAEEMDRSAYLELLNGFFQAVTDAVHTAGGEVLKFIGDAVLAVFLADSGRQAACQAAVAAGVAIRDGVSNLIEPDGTSVRAATGLSFGNVTYGNVGSIDRLDFTVIGKAANVAARLSDLAKDLDVPVLAGDLAGQGSNLEFVGVQHLHNIAEPIEVWGLPTP